MTKKKLTLFCVVDGESASHAFKLKNIPSSDDVDDLKQRIKAQQSPDFDDIDANKLTLWRVSIPVGDDDDDDEHPILLDEVSVKKKLKSTRRLNLALKLRPDDTDLPDGTELSDAIILPEDTIHIIVERPPPDLISEFDFLQHVPGGIIGEQQRRDTGRSSSYRAYAYSPSPRSWDILDSVLSMELDPGPKYKRPQFMEDRTYAPESMLHVLFRHDIGSVRVLPPFADTTQTMSLRCGAPDLVCRRMNSDRDLPESILFPIEIKRPADLRSGNLVGDYKAQEQSGASEGPGEHLRQAFGYMRLNGYRYGILSTYEQTWFLKRGDGDVDHDLKVSPTIAFDRSEPTLLQCYLWFIRQADSDPRPLDPPTDTELSKMIKDEERRQEKRRKTRESNRKNKSNKKNKPAKDRLSSIFGLNRTQLADRMILPAFDSMSLISRGEHAQTYKASWGGHNVVVKKCDIWNQGPVVEELRHEARVYQVLRTLQGRYIPELRFAGVADGMEMILVTDFVGSEVSHKRLDDSDQEKIWAALSAIHDLGVVHGDIRPQNIVVQHDGPSVRFYFVDFGLSQTGADTTERDWEKDVLDSLLQEMAGDRS